MDNVKSHTCRRKRQSMAWAPSVESGVVVTPVVFWVIVVSHRQRHRSTCLPSVSMEEGPFHCRHQHLTELSRALLGPSRAPVSNERSVFVIARASIGTKDIGHHRVLRHKRGRLAVQTPVHLGHSQRAHVHRCENHSLKSSHKGDPSPCSTATQVRDAQTETSYPPGVVSAQSTWPLQTTPNHPLVFSLVSEGPWSLSLSPNAVKRGVHGGLRVVIHGFCRFRMSSNLSHPVMVVASQSPVNQSDSMRSDAWEKRSRSDRSEMHSVVDSRQPRLHLPRH